jgi:ribonuclease HI
MASHDTQSSPDNTTNTRGTWLLRSCSDLSLHILNSLPGVKGSHNAFTSFQPLGNSVIDYAIANALALPMVYELTVERVQAEWSDHATLVLHITLPPTTATDITCEHVPNSHTLTPRLPDDTVLDRLLIDTIKSIPDKSEKQMDMYGQVWFDTNPVLVWVDDSCHENGSRNATAGYAAYWGPNTPKNMYGQVPGSQTNQRAELFGFLTAVESACPRTTLWIHTDSQYVIRMVTYWAHCHEQQGWSCKNGDVLQAISAMLRHRAAPTRLVYVKGHSGIRCTVMRLQTRWQNKVHYSQR